MELGEPQNLLVPSNTTESEGAEVLAAVFEPLVNYNENKQAVEAAAESITSDDNVRPGRSSSSRVTPGTTVSR